LGIIKRVSTINQRKEKEDIAEYAISLNHKDVIIVPPVDVVYSLWIIIVLGSIIVLVLKTEKISCF